MALRFRRAAGGDADAIAALHADSWRRHYRGAYSDAFLDGDVDTDRVAVWTERLQTPDPRRYTVLATKDGTLVGFANTEFDDDPTWGSLLDNLHVTHDSTRRGIGSHLLALTAQAVIERGTGLYLWVLEQNTDARSFYEAHGATRVERAPTSPPGGVPSRLAGPSAKLRYAWSDRAALLELAHSAPAA